MEYLRTLVSGKKKRFTDRKFDLDLSYITPRIIAMAYPGSGIETVYRNNINNVAEFLQERHNGKYRVINLSGKKYDYSKFNKNVSEYNWIDHQAPQLKLLFVICKEMHDFLKQNNENIVAVNCRAGKGRTGTVICCYLLFTGRFDSVEKALDYYSKKRFNIGEGVTQPSQKRYVYYFNRILKEKIFLPLVRNIESIHLFNYSNKSTLRPYFEIYLGNTKVISFTTQNKYSEQKKIFVNNSKDICITDNEFNFSVFGDVTLKIYNNEYISTKKIGRVSFNTAFLDLEAQFITFNLKEIDPDNLSKKKSVSKDFSISVFINLKPVR